MDPEGLERFARALDEYFVRLMAHVLEQGGDVVTIAGDAFFCVFPDDDPHVAVRRAVTAALLIQRDLDGHAIADDRRFGTRIGIAAGDLSVAPLGGVGGQWHLVVTGSAVDEVEVAEHVVPVGRDPRRARRRPVARRARGRRRLARAWTARCSRAGRGRPSWRIPTRRSSR